MDSKTLDSLLEAGAVKKCKMIGNGSKIHVLITSINGTTNTLMTNKSSVKTWSSFDSAAKWLKKAGIGEFTVEVAKWTPNQKSMV